MNQSKNIYQKLGVSEVSLELENLRLEALNRREKQLWRGGNRKNPVTIKQVIIEFWSRVKIGNENECWNWSMALNSKESKYGIMWIFGSKYKAHRLAYTFSKGDTGSLLVCHTCDNPTCCNPSHLFLGTSKDNAQDCISKGRFKKEIGEDRYCAKLNQEAVRDIRENYKKRIVGAPVFMKKYNVSQTAIFNVIHGIRWKHVA